MTYLSLRILGNNTIHVQYLEDGKAKDAAFMTWTDFITWLQIKTKQQEA